MKRFLIGFLSALFVMTSVLGASSKGPRARRAAGESPGSGASGGGRDRDSRVERTLWI